MKIFLLLALSACAVPARSQPLPVQSQPDAYTPATSQRAINNSVHNFVKAINRNDYFGAQNQIDGARIGYFGAQVWLANFVKNSSFEIELLSAEPLQLAENRAQVVVTYRLNSRDKSPSVTQKETLQWKRGSDVLIDYKNKVKVAVWQIVPPQMRPAETLPSETPTVRADLLSYFSWKLAQKPLAPADYAPEKSLSNLKQLAMAAALLSQDYDSMAAAPEYLHEALFPYLKDESVFFVPNSYEPYAFNANLSERFIDISIGFPVVPPANAVAQPENVVLFYEGRDEQLNFRYDGRAAVALADGRVALVTPTEAKNLRWLP